MRYVLVLTLFLVACADKPKSDETVCVEDPFPFQFTFSDGQDLKSARVTCSNGCTTIKSLDPLQLTETICQ